MEDFIINKSKKYSLIVLVSILVLFISLGSVVAEDVSVIGDDDTVKMTDVESDSAVSSNISSINPGDFASGNSIYVSPTGSDSGTGSSSDPYKTISKAVSVAKSGTTIFLYDGTYSGSSNNNIRVLKSLNFVAMDNTLPTVIDGGGVNRLFSIGGNITVNFLGLTLQNGRAVNGSAISVYNAYSITTVNIVNCTLKDNYATSMGGALYISGMSGSSYSKFIIENSTLVNNYAVYDGGAVFVDNGGSLSIRHTNLTNNRVNSNNGFGGAVYNSYLTWCYGAVFENNTAFNGGAIYNNYGNLYTYYNKGENTLFISNVAYGSGGAIYKVNTGISRINNTFFRNNSARYGGAIALINSTGNMTIINSTFAYNTASTEGGAIYNNARSSVYTSYCALYGNNAPTGKSISSKNTQCTADYNWWGNNTNPYTSGDTSFQPNTYVIMGMNVSDNGDTVAVKATLNQYYDTRDKAEHNLVDYIPFNLVTFNCTEGFIAPTEATLNHGEYTATYYKAEDMGEISATIGSQTLSTVAPGTGILLTVDNLTANLGDTVNVTGTVSINTIPVTSGIVSLPNGATAPINDDGTFSIPFYVNITTSGLHYIPITFSNDEGKTTSMLALTVGAIPTILTMDDITGSLGDTVALNVYVKDNAGNDVSGIAKIHIYNQNTEVEVFNGVGTSQYTIIQPVGQYRMTATFTGDGYASSKGEANLIVTRQKVIISIPQVNGDLGETITIPINVTNRLGDNVNGTLIVDFNRKTRNLTVVNGHTEFNVTLPEVEGNYNLTATYPEQGDYGETIEVATVGVGVTNTIITGEDLTFKYGTPHDYTIKLTDVNGAVIVGRHVNFKLTRTSSGASKTYSAVTDYEGKATLTINLAAGNYTVETTFDGEHNRFQPSSCFNTIKITTDDPSPEPVTNKTITYISSQDFTEKYGDAGYFKGKLLTSDGTPVVGHHISVKLTRVSSGANKAYDVVTDYTGEFMLQINLAPGNYTAESTYEGILNYSSSSANNKITVTKA